MKEKEFTTNIIISNNQISLLLSRGIKSKYSATYPKQ